MLSELPIDIIIYITEYLDDLDMYRLLHINKTITREVVNTSIRLKNKYESIGKQIRSLCHLNEYIMYIKKFQWDFLRVVHTFSTFTIDNYPTQTVMPLKELILVFDSVDKILEHVYIPIKTSTCITLYGSYIVNGIMYGSITKKMSRRVVRLDNVYESYSPRIKGSCYVFITDKSYDDITKFKYTIQHVNTCNNVLEYTKYYIPFKVEEIAFMVKYCN